jgi:hypothetical protein
MPVEIGPEPISADQIAFWSRPGAHIWVARREQTDITLEDVTEASVAFAAPRAGGNRGDHAIFFLDTRNLI